MTQIMLSLMLTIIYFHFQKIKMSLKIQYLGIKQNS
jgi:hypothetical protein